MTVYHPYTELTHEIYKMNGKKVKYKAEKKTKNTYIYEEFKKSIEFIKISFIWHNSALSIYECMRNI